jgi:uncharacterized membrane protein YjgN (DUF898 family)
MRIPTIERKGFGGVEAARPAGGRDQSQAQGQAEPLPGGAAYAERYARPPLSPLPQGEVRLEAIKAPLAWHVVRGVFLSVVTLGIHRFWYRTALRRYYWSNTRLGGDAFEYTGTGKELFIGFLVAIAIVIPLYLVVTLIGLFGGHILGPIVASAIGAVFMPAVVQILVYRARRYRLQRTRFRGVRFHQTGSGTGYLLRSISWLVLTGITLGLAFPWLRRALERYKIEHTWYGSAQGRFEAQVGPAARFWFLLWLVILVAVGCTAMMGFHLSTMKIGEAFVFGAAALALVVVLPILWQGYRVREFRAFVGGTRIGEVSLTSDLRLGPVVWVWLSYYLVLMVLAAGVGGFGWLVFGGRAEGLDGGARDFFRSAGGLFALYGTIFAFFILTAIVTELVLRRRLWALRARSITVTNLAALDAVVQTASKEAMGVGEAFDTGFDIAG